MKTALTRTTLIEKANEELRLQPWFEDGMQIEDVKMVGHILAMDAAGMTGDSGELLVDRVQKFDHFIKSFAERYTLAN